MPPLIVMITSNKTIFGPQNFPLKKPPSYLKIYDLVVLGSSQNYHYSECGKITGNHSKVSFAGGCSELVWCAKKRTNFCFVHTVGSKLIFLLSEFILYPLGILYLFFFCEDGIKLYIYSCKDTVSMLWEVKHGKREEKCNWKKNRRFVVVNFETL